VLRLLLLLLGSLRVVLLLLLMDDAWGSRVLLEVRCLPLLVMVGVVLHGNNH
jgi:hypothetical protein